MRIISDEIGFCLSFKSLEELQWHVRQLQQQVEWIQENDVQAPHLYLVYGDRVSDESAREFLEELKPSVVPVFNRKS